MAPTYARCVFSELNTDIVRSPDQVGGYGKNVFGIAYDISTTNIHLKSEDLQQEVIDVCMLRIPSDLPTSCIY